MKEDLFKAWEFAYEGLFHLNRAENELINEREILDQLIDAKENFKNSLVYIDELIEKGLE